MRNKYFTQYSFGREQDLVEDLILESIKIYGHDIKYLPRTMVKQDDLFGEDVLSKFEEAIDLEMYLKSVEGFEGDGQFLSKFGLEIRDQIVLTVARKRFDQAVTSPKIMTEVGYNLIFEDGSTTTPSRQHLTGDINTDSWMLEGDDYLNNLNRPQEGDIIYFPMIDKIYEVMHVDKTPILYQMGRLQVYDLRCEVYEYSSEIISTGNTAIDSVQTQFSLDVLDNQIQLEGSTDVLKNEDGDTILTEFRIETQDATANNTLFDTLGANVLDFSEGNPFSEVDRW